MKKQPRVAIYHHANHSNNTALLHHLVAYAQKGNLEPTIFLDIASGVGKRPALEDLLNHVRSQKVDIIIIHSLSRFSRNSSEVTAILDEFRKYNVKLSVPNVRMEVAHHE
ncbi:recombinase family protein [Niallia circulans]|uniref:recombinase family protein n=1 Tax=Niallia circulans TaxID=1397 RepID=UPI001F161EC8|nr:recombinase family protein [Niallia circulans]MCF2647415.1 recombinase family protein [Niallia circulans]